MVKKMTAVLLGMLLASLMLAGCAAASAEQIYGKEDTNIEVNKGENFVIQLEENPTTGYAWTVSVSDDSIVMLAGDEYEPESTDGDIVGAGGTHAYTFEALEKGTAQITFVYERSFEENSAVETIVYNVTVN